MSREKLYWICQLGGWSLYGLLNLSILIFSGGIVRWVDWAGTLLQILFYIGSTHWLRHIIQKRGFKTFSVARLIPLVIAANFILGFLNYLFLIGTSYAMGGLIPSVEFRIINLILGVLGPAAMYFLWSLLYFTYHYFEQYRKSLRYETVIRDTELSQLRSQLNPHFIFNALNSIRALVDEDPKKSKLAITQLSSIIRNSLLTDKSKLVRMEEEIQTVRDYLGLESIRFEERLKATVDMNPHTKYFQIPPMMIQTLVENGIKHGISKQKEGGFIEVKTYLESDFLIIQIRNSGVYLEKQQSKQKYGLSNTRKRLELIYGDKADFKIENEKDKVVLMQITLPRDTRHESNIDR